MADTLHSDRDKGVLRSLVEQHVSTGQPVGSNSIVNRGSLVVSAATVRKTMGNLEDAGYITRPHPSAGGIPTEKGYRYYVDTLLQINPINMVKCIRFWSGAQYLRTGFGRREHSKPTPLT